MIRSYSRSNARCLPALFACAICWTTIAQPPADTPKPADETPDSATDELSKTPAAPRAPASNKPAPAITIPSAIDPKKGAVPGIRDADSGVPSTRRLYEGAFLNRRAGRMLKAPTGDWIFVPLLTDGTGDDRPMVVVPSSTLERIETALSGVPSGRPSVELSGQVLSYRDREYLLLQQPSSVRSAGEVPAHDATLRKPESKPNEQAPAGEDQAVQDLIRDLEAMRTEAKAVTPSRALREKTPPATATAPGTAPTQIEGTAKPLVPEGTLLTGRRGRIIRMGAGELAFAADGDTDGVFDRPMVLAPCQTLKRMEDLIRWRGDEFILVVSGRILAYQGRNYFLPTMFVVPPPSDLEPLQ